MEKISKAEMCDVIYEIHARWNYKKPSMDAISEEAEVWHRLLAAKFTKQTLIQAINKFQLTSKSGYRPSLGAIAELAQGIQPAEASAASESERQKWFRQQRENGYVPVYADMGNGRRRYRMMRIEDCLAQADGSYRWKFDEGEECSG